MTTMNIGYLFDLSNMLSEGDIQIPYLGHIYFSRMDYKDLTVKKIVEVRDNVMEHVHEEVNKHLLFFVIKNDEAMLKALSKCISDIQTDTEHFNSEKYAIHVVCNFVEEGGFYITKYEKEMPCLKNNSVGVYTWLLDKYDYNADKPISASRRAHAIVRMVWELCQHNDISNTLLQMTNTKEPQPIYNLFGNAAVFFDADSRTKAVSDYYSYKSLQQLLNLPDKKLDEYFKANVLPFVGDKRELDKRIDATAETFLRTMSVPIEASIITEKTQGLLIKSSDDDKDYLVNATDNKLVFIDELAKANGWQLENMDTFLSGYQAKVNMSDELQETVSEDFLRELYYDKFITHEREGFDRINNQVSDSRKSHVYRFKQNVDNYTSGFLNQKEGGPYTWLQIPLSERITKTQHTCFDYGLAFMDYLESGKGDGLVDKDVSMGDIYFTRIKDSSEKEEAKRRKEYEEKKKAIEEKYLPQNEDKPAKVVVEFEKADKRIKQCLAEKRQWEFQLSQWVDGDAAKKLTARSKALIAFSCGILAALLWLLLSKTIIGGIFDEPSDTYILFERILFGGFIVAGIIIALIIILNARRCLKEAEEALANARRHKQKLMDICVKDMNDITECHYQHLLAYHGLKTINELVDFTKWKRDDLIQFRKALFKLMLRYRLSATESKKTGCNDENTFELTDADVDTLLFGPEDNRRDIPYCFAQDGFSMSETFNEFKRKKIRFETTRDFFNFSSKEYDLTDTAKLEAEVIPCMKEHENSGIQYTALQETSILPTSTDGVEMNDVHQGQCGDCYFMATLAAIAQQKPEYIIGKNGMVEELGEGHKYFRVKFYNKDGNRVNVDIDNRFWNKDNHPHYAKRGVSANEPGSYDPWVMAVEKAWAKVNGDGYDGIEGARSDGKEVERQVEYSFAVTGKSAFYCRTKNVDAQKLRDMMKKHFIDDKLPITLYSVNEKESTSADSNIVNYHAYALSSAYEDGTFDIFNPWNTHEADEDVKGKHYKKVDITFIKDNFCVVVFFGIKEGDFASFERDLTSGNTEEEMTKGIRKMLDDSFASMKLSMSTIEELLSEDKMGTVLRYTNYLFSRNRITDPRGVDSGSNHLVFLEGGKVADAMTANGKMVDYLKTHLSSGHALQPVLLRDDGKQMLTVIRISPHYVKGNFNI